jgi:hypothetical protein
LAQQSCEAFAQRRRKVRQAGGGKILIVLGAR